ncbi:MAG: 5'/3'-nucleotidase SurE, partial [Acetobacterales bacterium]
PGTPTDCVLMALRHLLLDEPPDLVLSGVNHGANLGEDVLYSGTVAAATEATQLGFSAIAFSQCLDESQTAHWSAVETFGERVVRDLWSAGWTEGVLVNVNFPPLPGSAITGIRVTSLGRRDADLRIEERIDPDGRPYYWMVDFADTTSRRGNTDLRAIQEGAVSATPLALNRTHRPSVRRLRSAFA